MHQRLAQTHPGLLTAIVPRHPERGAAIAGALGDAPRRALGQDPGDGLWIADTLGEVGLLYRLFPIVFHGQEFCGWRRPEPSGAGPIVLRHRYGPDTANFADAVAALRTAGGLAEVADAAALAVWVEAMLRDPAARRAMGEAARAAAGAQAQLPASSPRSWWS
ncbi:MAG: hypothetical protein WDN04_27225 [Rhodospirillales bacterium]